MEQTLFICRSVDLYQIPPRTGRGHISGEWRTDDKIFTARCRVVATADNTLEIRLEDPANGEIFGACPVQVGQRDAAVESAVDSSRNFVLRIVDPATQRHAFLGMNFADRTNAFDFNVALTDFERRLQREEELKKAAAAGGGAPLQSSSEVAPEAAALYQKRDLHGLKEGEHISVNVKKTGHAGGFLARLGAGNAAATSGSEQLPKLAPLAPPPATVAAVAAPAARHQQQQQSPGAAKVVASTTEGWATF